MSTPAAARVGAGAPIVVRTLSAQSGADGVIVSVRDDVAFDDVRAELHRVLGQTPERWRNRLARLDLGDRDLELFDVRRLVHLLKGDYGLSVTAVYTTERSVHRYVARELKLQVFTRDPAADCVQPLVGAIGESSATAVTEVGPESIDQDGVTEVVSGPAVSVEDTGSYEVDDELVDEDGAIADLSYDDEGADDAPAEPEPAVVLPVEPAPIRISGGQRVQSIPRSLRGGQSVRFPGDVVVYGDVNPGAVVEAGGNILVFGALRGLAHAGTHGDEAAVILAFDLRPTQLRIGGRIAFQGLEDDVPRGPGFRPEIAFVDDERIRIEPWRGRLPTEQVATGAEPPSTKTPGESPSAAPVTEQ